MPIPMAAMMGAQMVGSMVQSIMGGYQQAEQMARQDIQFQQKEYERQLQVDAQNAVINQQNANRLINNRQLALSGGRQLAAKLYAIDEGYQASSRQLSQAYSAQQASLKSNMAGRNLASGSGTAKALAQMASQNLRNSQSNLMRQKKVAKQNADMEYRNLLNKRDLNMQSNVYFMKGVSPVGDPNNAIKAGWLNAAATGITFAAAGGFSGMFPGGNTAAPAAATPVASAARTTLPAPPTVDASRLAPPGL